LCVVTLPAVKCITLSECARVCFVHFWTVWKAYMSSTSGRLGRVCIAHIWTLGLRIMSSTSWTTGLASLHDSWPFCAVGACVATNIRLARARFSRILTRSRRWRPQHDPRLSRLVLESRWTYVLLTSIYGPLWITGFRYRCSQIPKGLQVSPGCSGMCGETGREREIKSITLSVSEPRRCVDRRQ